MDVIINLAIFGLIIMAALFLAQFVFAAVVMIIMLPFAGIAALWTWIKGE